MNEFFFNSSQRNPFSTRFIAPGKMPFFFERSYLHQQKSAHPDKFEEFFTRALGSNEDIRTSVSIRFLIDQFERYGCRGQIVGAHGTGKSSLMSVLKNELSKLGYEIFFWELHDQQRFLPDLFWLELQEFLRSTPKFMPTRCLLPPPVVSREEYLAQQRESLREIFGDHSVRVNSAALDQDEEDLDEIETVEEFQATGDAEGPAVEKKEKKETRRQGCYGFNSAGRFGFLSSTEAAETIVPGSKPVAFEPFQGVEPANEEVTNENDRDEDPSIEVNMLTAAVLKEQKKLAIPLPVDYGMTKNRSFFDKKVVFFDGFEQLSYVNRIIVRSFCRLNHLGLLLTTHTPAIGVPVLFRTNPSVETLGLILDFLLEDPDMVPDDSQLAILLNNFHNDVRAILFSLYDAYEKYRWAPREVREKIVRRYPR